MRKAKHIFLPSGKKMRASLCYAALGEARTPVAERNEAQMKK